MNQLSTGGTRIQKRLSLGLKIGKIAKLDESDSRWNRKWRVSMPETFKWPEAVIASCRGRRDGAPILAEGNRAGGSTGRVGSAQVRSGIRFPLEPPSFLRPNGHWLARTGAA